MKNMGIRILDGKLVEEYHIKGQEFSSNLAIKNIVSIDKDDLNLTLTYEFFLIDSLRCFLFWEFLNNSNVLYEQLNLDLIKLDSFNMSYSKLHLVKIFIEFKNIRGRLISFINYTNRAERFLIYQSNKIEFMKAITQNSNIKTANHLRIAI